MAEFLPYAELDRDQKWYVDNKYPDERLKAAHKGWGLDVLAYDPDPSVRNVVARNGIASEELSHDEDKHVRMGVLASGYLNESLVFDQDNDVRVATAKAARRNDDYGILEILTKDKSTEVREEVAKHRAYAPYLALDKSVRVRAAVANSGCALDILAEDSDNAVRRAAKLQLAKLGMTPQEWADANPDYTAKKQPGRAFEYGELAEIGTMEMLEMFNAGMHLANTETGTDISMLECGLVWQPGDSDIVAAPYTLDPDVLSHELRYGLWEVGCVDVRVGGKRIEPNGIDGPGPSDPAFADEYYDEHGKPLPHWADYYNDAKEHADQSYRSILQAREEEAKNLVMAPRAATRPPADLANDDTAMRAASGKQSINAPAKDQNREKGKVV